MCFEYNNHKLAKDKAASITRSLRGGKMIAFNMIKKATTSVDIVVIQCNVEV